MFKKTLIAAAAAGLIAAGSLATATVAAAAGPSGHGYQQGRGTASGQNFGGVYFGGPGWSIGFATPGFQPRHFRPRQVCKPVFKRVSWWRHGRLQSRVIKVGERCQQVRPARHPQPGWGRYPSWGYGWGYGRGPGRGFSR